MAATPASMLMSVVGPFGLATGGQAPPTRCSVSVSYGKPPSLWSPTAQMSLAETALTALTSLKDEPGLALAAWDQPLPFRCTISAAMPEEPFVPPIAQALSGPSVLTPNRTL